MKTPPNNWGPGRRPLLTLDEAWSAIAGEVRHAAPEFVNLADAADRILAQPVAATQDWPLFDKAMMDGFAVQSADCTVAGARLNIAGLAAAGAAADRRIQSGEAMRINTGAPLPIGADAVVRIEDTHVADDLMTVEIKTQVAAGKHVAPKGADRRTGELLLAAPMTIEAAQMAALATAGCTRVSVYPKVHAAIVLTGNEIVPIGETLAAGQIHDSNGPMLASLVRQFGATPRRVGIARDDKTDLRSKLIEALECPVVISVGGMSMGTLDLVPSVCAELGVEWRFHGVNMRPGKPVAYGRGPQGQHVFGLPGNPVSAFVCAWLFVRMALRGLVGHPCKPPHRLRATLTRCIEPKRDARPAFVPARFWNHSEAGELVEPCAWGGSGDPFGLAMANALLVLNDPTRGIAADETVEVIPISTEL
ncbi:MAG: molybdopterin molybdotransferase MoeA [Phycisphaerales bacterium]|nr:molybdopterin molybdotransferase MoeA [Phycisphaerales bacterium]MCB9857385.1 molybdopterin molybdotransferase MoeA [Phycisphaerales bacterium]